MEYQEYLNSADWLAKRLTKLRQNPKCEVCDSLKSLQVHHLNYRNLYDVQPTDLMTLCQTCHYLGHDLLDSLYYSTSSSVKKAAILKAAVLSARREQQAGITILPRPRKRIIVRPPVPSKPFSQKKGDAAKAWSKSGFTSPSRAMGALIYDAYKTDFKAKISRLSGPCKVIYSRK